jgi:hypothetical protein
MAPDRKEILLICAIFMMIALAGCASPKTDVPTPSLSPVVTMSYNPVIIHEPPPVTTSPLSNPETTCDCSYNRYNCDDFSTHTAAQSCYDYCKTSGKGDIHQLDRDKNGLACE